MTVREHAALAIAARTYRYPGIRDQHIRHETGWSPTRYYAVLDALIDRPDVEAAYPVLVRRLRRVREARARARGA